MNVQSALAALQSNDVSSRETALADLSRVARADVTEAVFLRLRAAAAALTVTSDGIDATFVSQLLNTAVHFGDARVVEIAMSLMSKKLPRNDHQIETNAIDALVKLRATSAVPFLGEKLLDKTFSEHREDEVADAIGNLGGAAAQAILIGGVASKRPSVALAAAKALSWMPGPEVRAALERAAKTKNPELSVAARLSLVSIDDDPVAALRAEMRLPAGPPGSESAVLYRLRELAQPQLTAVLLEMLETPRWKPWSQDIYKLLFDHHAPGVEAALERLHDDESGTPWVRATAAAYLVQLNPARADELLDFLLRVIESEEMREQSRDVHPNEGDSARLVAETLTMALPIDPARFVHWLRLLDGWRRLEPRTAMIHAIAGDFVEKITGSRMYRDFDVWLAAYRAKHDV